MIFRRYFSLQSKKNPEELAKYIIGQHLQVHGLDFEIFAKDDGVKIIPHAENDEKFRTMPITSLKLKKNNTGGTSIRMVCKPRRIDSGGPTLLALFLIIALVGGIVLFFKEGEDYRMVSYILGGIGLIGGTIFFLRLQAGYYDYIRKIKAWVISHI